MFICMILQAYCNILAAWPIFVCIFLIFIPIISSSLNKKLWDDIKKNSDIDITSILHDSKENKELYSVLINLNNSAKSSKIQAISILSLVIAITSLIFSNMDKLSDLLSVIFCVILVSFILILVYLYNYICDKLFSMILESILYDDIQKYFK